MAAQMLSRVWSRSRQGFRYVNTQASEQGYYVLLPEVPPDTAENNPIMRTGDYPEFQQIPPDRVVTGCAKLAIQFDVELGKLVEELEETKKKPTFEDIFDVIEEKSVPLTYAWKTSKTLSDVRGPAYKKVAQRKLSESNRLSEHQSRLINMYITEAKQNGADIEDPQKKKHFLFYLTNLIESQDHFRKRVMLSHNMFSQIIDDYGMLAEMPKQVLHTMAVNKSFPSKGPWRVTLDNNVSQTFLQYCSNRMMRFNVWHALNNRANVIRASDNLSNHKIIEQIRDYRKHMAKLLGFENYAELSMQTKMAGSVENVLNMLESYKAKLLPKAKEEINCLQDFAASNGFKGTLEMHDIPYWRRKQRTSLYQFSDEDLVEFFTLDSVLQKLFVFCHKMFGITIKDKTPSVQHCSSDSRFYEVSEGTDGRTIAAFYIDPYFRPPDKQPVIFTESLRSGSRVADTFPISYMHFNFQPPQEGQETLLTPYQASLVFHEFGHGLQQLLTAVPYSDIGGQYNVEVDSLLTCAKVMQAFFFHPSLMASFSSHCKNSEQISQDVVDGYLQSRSHMQAFDTMHELYLSAFDMEMSLSEKSWVKVSERLWDVFMPIAFSPDDDHPCSFTDIFSGRFPAAYYSQTWSKMLCADLMTTFDEVGFKDEDKIKAVGRRFRDTYFALGGGASAGEVFRRFQGRDPSLDALISAHHH